MRNKLIFLMVILFSISFVIAQGGYYYQIDLSFSGTTVSLDSADILFDHREVENFKIFEEANYELKIFDSERIELYSETFSLPNKIIGEEIEDGNIVLEDGSFSLIIPYYNNAHKIIIFNQGVEMDSILVSQYSKEGYDQDDFRDTNQVVEENVPEDNFNDTPIIVDGGGSSITALLGIILVTLIGFLIYLLRKKD